MKHSLLCFAYVILTVYTTSALVNTGTIVIFQLAKDKFIIAADSRGVFEDKHTDDNQCKIAAFKSHGIIFSASNTTAYPNAGIADLMPSWNVIDEARRAVEVEDLRKQPQDAIHTVNSIASVWENSVLTLWIQMMLFHPAMVLDVASKNNGHLTHGIFAVARRGAIAIALTGIVFNNGNLSIERPVGNCEAGPCATGMTDIFKKYMASGSDFMTTSPSLSKSSGYELLRAIRLVELTIAEDHTGVVHGPIDALELSNDGTVRWRQKKENCPESSD